MYWVDHARDAGLTVDKIPTVHSVIAWGKNGKEHSWKGHVAVIEKN